MADPANPAQQVAKVGLTPAEQREREEARAAKERAKRDGPVEGETVVVDGEEITTAEAIERANAEEGGFIGRTGKDPDEDEALEPDEVQDPPSEVALEDLPDTREKLEALVRELVKFRSEAAALKGKLTTAVEKANKAFRERDEANAEVDAYFKQFGPLA